VDSAQKKQLHAESFDQFITRPFAYLPGDFMKKRSIALAVAAATLAAPSANAAFVNGGVSFIGFYQNQAALTFLPNSIVSQLTSFDVAPSTTVGGGTFDFSSVSGIGAATDFNILALPQLMFAIDGYSFTVQNWAPVSAVGLSCDRGECADSIAFTGFGEVTKAGFQATGFTIGWSSQGTCGESLAVSGQCATGSGTASYSASISATGTEPFRVPEPASVALVSLALLGTGMFSRRRKA